MSLQLFLNAGALLATGFNKAFSVDTSSVGWKTVTGIQFVFAVCKFPLISGCPVCRFPNLNILK